MACIVGAIAMVVCFGVTETTAICNTDCITSYCREYGCLSFPCIRCEDGYEEGCDRSADMPCGSNGHMCDHPQCKCIDSGKLCNGKSDCTNSSDEATCDSDLKALGKIIGIAAGSGAGLFLVIAVVAFLLYTVTRIRRRRAENIRGQVGLTANATMETLAVPLLKENTESTEGPSQAPAYPTSTPQPPPYPSFTAEQTKLQNNT